ncbi:hypothetical protein JQ600_09550 [Bradyrhizobium sp. AUGA SZCCT0176]|uniref:hypothetical protein n=1 Tax=Bradyrhizobium sp. AUGA SZCCT0176 TaxID=2807664 RepID=UPI001BA903A7|nr:hypothetical protein [Bradyrhizobium sp. AUGA SZCCT0176]MBR1225161.1 hypothetical protein [Bradyrhizobium sp. AUGA SZCCT0176]
MNYPMRVAIVGSGPSGFYATEALLTAGIDVEVDMFERLPTPFGLVRHGVAPDHPKLKSIVATYESIAADTRFSFFGNVEIGKQIEITDLLRCYHSAIIAVGAASDRKLGIPAEHLPGVHGATAFVGWYNGHPDFRDLHFDFSHEAAVVIGHGNVAIDVCRILLKPVDDLRHTDIAQHALEALSQSRVREVHLIGRRDPSQAKFSPKELRELTELDNCTVSVDPTDLADHHNDGLTRGSTPAKNIEILRSTLTTRRGSGRRCLIGFNMKPVEICGSDRVEAVRFLRTRCSMSASSTAPKVEIPAGLVIRSIGYQGSPLPGLPFDNQSKIIPHVEGRVQFNGESALPVYVAGWIKRGPTGIIGTNRVDSLATVQRLIEDSPSFYLGPKPGFDGLKSQIVDHATNAISFDKWHDIDAAERVRGEAIGKPREKFTRIEDMLRVAGR